MVISGLQRFYLMVESVCYDSHTSYLRIVFANTFVKTFGKWAYTKWWQQNYYFKFESILLM